MTLIKTPHGFIVAEHIAAIMDHDGLAVVTTTGGSGVPTNMMFDRFMDAFDDATSADAPDKKKK